MANGAAELAGGRFGGHLLADDVFAQRGQLFKRPHRAGNTLTQAAGGGKMARRQIQQQRADLFIHQRCAGTAFGAIQSALRA